MLKNDTSKLKLLGRIKNRLYPIKRIKLSETLIHQMCKLGSHGYRRFSETNTVVTDELNFITTVNSFPHFFGSKTTTGQLLFRAHLEHFRVTRERELVKQVTDLYNVRWLELVRKTVHPIKRLPMSERKMRIAQDQDFRDCMQRKHPWSRTAPCR